MDEYIKRANAIEAVKRARAKGFEPAQYLEIIPPADVALVRHGRWIERKSFHADGGVSAKCSVCKNDVQYLGNPLNYCPNCGAKMDGGKG